jgi:hypothetical protein
LLGADDGGFYVGLREEPGAGELDRPEFCYTQLLYYAVSASGFSGPVVLWQGTIPASSSFLPFFTGAGFLVPSGDMNQGNPYILKMIWGANRQAGPMETYAPDTQLDNPHRVFASNGLTYLEIQENTYCWRLLTID